MPEGVLFDFFGTLVEYSPSRSEQGYHDTHQLVVGGGLAIDYATFLNTWVEAAGLCDAWSQASGKEFAMYQVGEKFAELAGWEAPDQLIDNIVDSYICEWSRGVSPIDGVRSLLESLAKRHRLGLITNTHYPPMVHRLLSQIEIQHLFEVVITSVEYGVPKPDTSIFDHSLALMSLSTEQAVYVGDNYQADYLGATRAGLRCILIGEHARVPRLDSIPSVLDLPGRLY